MFLVCAPKAYCSHNNAWVITFRYHSIDLIGLRITKYRSHTRGQVYRMVSHI